MAPVYGTFSCLSIWFHDHHGYLLYIRDIYESLGKKYKLNNYLVIYYFFKLLYYFVSWDSDKKRTDKTKIYSALKGHEFHGHPVPFNFFCPTLSFVTEESCYSAFWSLRNGVLQYIPVKIAVATIDIFDLWAWEWLPASNVIYYVAATVTSVSVSVAMYYLVFFFHTLHK